MPKSSKRPNLFPAGKPFSKNKDPRAVKSAHSAKCHQCSLAMQGYVHADDWKPKEGQKYYRYWYRCHNPDCKTDVVTPTEAYCEGTRP